MKGYRGTDRDLPLTGSIDFLDLLMVRCLDGEGLAIDPTIREELPPKGDRPENIRCDRRRERWFRASRGSGNAFGLEHAVLGVEREPEAEPFADAPHAEVLREDGPDDPADPFIPGDRDQSV